MLLFSGMSGVICIFGFPQLPVNGHVPGSGGNATVLCYFKGKSVEGYNGQKMGWITAGTGLVGLANYLIVVAWKCIKDRTKQASTKNPKEED